MRQAYLPPNTKQIIAAFKVEFETPNGKVEMLGNGHQAIHGTSYGTTRTNGKVYRKY